MGKIEKEKILAKIYGTIFVYIGEYLAKIMGNKVIEGFYERVGKRTAEEFKPIFFKEVKVSKKDKKTVDKILKTIAEINKMDARTYGYTKYTILASVNYCPFASIMRKHKLYYMCNFCNSVTRNIISNFGYNLEVPEKISEGEKICKFVVFTKKEKVRYKGKGKKVKGFKVKKELQFILMDIALKELINEIENLTGKVAITLVKNGSYLAGKESGKEIAKSIKIKNKKKILEFLISLITRNLAKMEKDKIVVNKEKLLEELESEMLYNVFKSWISGVCEVLKIRASFKETKRYCYIKFNNNK